MSLFDKFKPKPSASFSDKFKPKTPPPLSDTLKANATAQRLQADAAALRRRLADAEAQRQRDGQARSVNEQRMRDTNKRITEQAIKTARAAAKRGGGF